MVPSAVAFAVVAVVMLCGGLANTLDPTERTREWQVGTYRGQFCYYHRTSTAGPALADAVGPVWPVVRVRGMESNLAAYTLVAGPVWPVLAAIGGPALAWVGLAWWGRLLREWHGRDRQRVGFEPILLPRREDDGGA